MTTRVVIYRGTDLAEWRLVPAKRHDTKGRRLKCEGDMRDPEFATYSHEAPR